MVHILQWPFSSFSEATVEDRDSGVTCLQEREIEALVRGKLSSDAEQRCRVHLLWCESCQSRVDEEAEFALATRSAVLVLERQKAKAANQNEFETSGFRRVRGWLQDLFSARIPMRWAAAGLSVGMLIAMAGLLPLHRESAGVDVVLQSERGSAVPVAVESAASANLRLRIEASDVSPASAFQVALVDSEGRPVETTTAGAVAGSVRVALHKKLTPGQYWVRLSTPQGNLLHEYALRVRP